MTDLLERFGFLLPGLKDLVQIIIVAAGIYYVLLVLARTRAIQMLVGLLVLVGLYIVARYLNLELIRYLLETLVSYGVIAALIVFQPELRNALARLGQRRLPRFLVTKLAETEVVEEVVEAVERLSRAKIGAIIAIQRMVPLGDYAETGTVVQARVSADMLASIFSPYGPLHDGAVLMEGDTIIAAGVILPLTQFAVHDRSLGTRHRAALGLSDETDALIVVVSEETAQVSVVQRSHLQRGISLDLLREILTAGGLAGRDAVVAR